MPAWDTLRRGSCYIASHPAVASGSMVAVGITDENNFQHILRILNTNVDGREKIWVALTAIRGIGRRFSVMCCKKADIDISKRAGELSPEEVEKLVAVMTQPLQFKMPVWFVNRRRDFRDSKARHVSSNLLDAALREDLERLKKIRAHRGLRHWWGVKVRGQHTKTTGRGGRSMGVTRKK